MFPLYDQNPTREKPVVTRALIYVNIAVFLFTWWMESQGVSWIAAGYGMVPARIGADPSGEAIKLISSMFLHADFLHLAWNMLFLHIFGDNVEDALGRPRYLAFYLTAGICGALAQYISGPLSWIPMVGASGAIAGVLGGYLVLYPRAPITILNPIPLLWLIMGPLMILPAWAVVGWWFIGNLFGGIASLGGQETQTAYMAHLGGFVAGLVITRALVTDPKAKENQWAGLSQPPRKPERKIFPKDKDSPFWR